MSNVFDKERGISKELPNWAALLREALHHGVPVRSSSNRRENGCLILVKAAQEDHSPMRV